MARTSSSTSSGTSGVDASETVSLRVTKAEKQLIELLAENHGDKASPFAKHVLMECLVKMLQHAGGVDAVVKSNLEKRQAAAEADAAAMAHLLKQLDGVPE